MSLIRSFAISLAYIAASPLGILAKRYARAAPVSVPAVTAAG